MSPTKIHGAERTIGSIFSDDFDFVIADYQRPYAWGTDEAGELFDDLITALDDEGKNTSIDDLNPYFLGSIVLIKDDKPKAEIVDGQQRLTTVTLLLAVLRTKIPDEYAKDLTKYLYAEGSIIQRKPNRYRLKPRKRDRDFFQKYVQDTGGIQKLITLDPATEDLSDSQCNYHLNAIHLDKKLSALTEEQRIRMLQFIIDRCFLVVVSTPDLDSAYRIFSVMNDRGMDLSPTDILKSETIGEIDDEQEREQYAQKWEDEEDDHGRDRFRILFAHIRTIYGKEKLRKTMLEGFREALKPSENPKHFIDNILIPLSDAYELIHKAGYKASSRAGEVNVLLRWLNQIDNFDWTPPAIRFLADHQAKPDEVVRFFTDLERLAASMMIRRIGLNDRLTRYTQLLIAMEKGEDLYQTGSPLQLNDKEKLETLHALDSELYLMVKQRLYVLLRLDDHLASGVSTFQEGIVTVEHVLPQHPSSSSEWTKWYPTVEDRNKYVHRLGNLVLLSRRKNSAAQNYDFTVKKDKYFKGAVANYSLTIQVLSEPTWTPDVIERRQKMLLSTLKNLWRL